MLDIKEPEKNVKDKHSSLFCRTASDGKNRLMASTNRKLMQIFSCSKLKQEMKSFFQNCEASHEFKICKCLNSWCDEKIKLKNLIKKIFYWLGLPGIARVIILN